MENHPIPQDVTGFQFKLVGSMTIKQFMYVAGGVLLAVIVYYLPITFLIKFPLIFALVLLGLAIAFLPLEGRPMDLMVANFFKALLKPNQFFYKKSGGQLSFTDLNLKPVTVIGQTQSSPTETGKPRHNVQKEEQLASLLDTLENEPKSSIDQKENQFLSALFTAQATPAGQAPQVVKLVPQQSDLHTASQQMSSLPSQQLSQQPVTIQNNVTALQTQQAKPTLPVQPAPKTVQSPITTPYTHVAAPSQASAPMAKPKTLPDFPNLITGTVKDPRGNILSGILVEVKNKDGESVRAFKTNALGQFASATQLPNGTYTINFEDPKGQHTFSPMALTINGAALAPLEIISVDAREELRKSLFG